MNSLKAINLRIKGVDDCKTLSDILAQQQINYFVSYTYEFEGNVPVCSGAIFTIEEKNNE